MFRKFFSSKNRYKACLVTVLFILTTFYAINLSSEKTLSQDINGLEKRETFDQYMRELVSETESQRKLFDKKWQ
jgi:hypothetical protein